MKNNDIGKRIALAGIGSAISLVFVVFAYFFDFLSLSFIVLSAGGIMLPLAKCYYREALIASAAVSLIGFFITNIYILVFISASGFYVVFTVFWHRKKLNIILGTVIKFIYSFLVFFIAYKVSKVVFVDVTQISFLKNLDKTALYITLNAVFSAAFIVYDIAIIVIYKELCKLVERVVK